MKKYTKIINGHSVVKNRSQIVINKKGMNIYNPTEEMIIKDGWIEYIPQIIDESDSVLQNSYDILQDIILEQYNSKTDISDKEALNRELVIYNWEKYIGKPLKKGQVVVYNNNVYRVIQDINKVLDVYFPSLDTASLYEVIVLTSTGEIDDPIEYIPPMEIFNSKYYIQNDILYRCIRDSGIALSHDLSTLTGLYVEQI